MVSRQNPVQGLVQHGNSMNQVLQQDMFDQAASHNNSVHTTHGPLALVKHDPAVVHKAIIDLYLEVKVRTWNEIDRLGENQLKRERECLLGKDSLTVLDYIKTSIEILMQLKDDGNENAGSKQG